MLAFLALLGALYIYIYDISSLRVKCNFYFSVPEEVCNFPDLWGYIGECRPLGVAFGSSGW